MHQELIHIYGPFGIHSFGLFIVLGLIIYISCFMSDFARAKIINAQQFSNVLSFSIMIALAGGRLLYVMTNPDDVESWWQIFAFWQGGFSLMGAIIALVIALPMYFKKNNIPTLPFLDLAAFYAPLLQSISRIGCFFAGCCFGKSMSIESYFFGACTHGLHPTQLYSAAALLGVFLVLCLLRLKIVKRPGQLACSYLILMSAERFILDFWRGDQEFLSVYSYFSVAQLASLAIGTLALVGLWYTTFVHRHE